MSRIKVDTAVNKTATGPVDFPSGITGVAATFTGNVTVGGTITYDDVQNVDSVGVVTAGKGLRVTTEGIVVTAGISTLSGGANLGGGNITFGDSGTVNDDRLVFGAGTDVSIYFDGSNPYIDASQGSFYIRNTDAQFIFQAKMDENSLILKPDGAVEAYHDNSKKLETTSSGVTVTGTVSDSDGNLRQIPKTAKTSSYTLVAADAGRCVSTDSGVEVPNAVFSAGDAVTIFNDSSSTITITQGSGFQLRKAGDTATGNIDLANFGLATLWFNTGGTAVITGNFA